MLGTLNMKHSFRRLLQILVVFLPSSFCADLSYKSQTSFHESPSFLSLQANLEYESGVDISCPETVNHKEAILACVDVAVSELKRWGDTYPEKSSVRVICNNIAMAIREQITLRRKTIRNISFVADQLRSLGDDYALGSEERLNFFAIAAILDPTITKNEIETITSELEKLGNSYPESSSKRIDCFKRFDVLKKQKNSLAGAVAKKDT